MTRTRTGTGLAAWLDGRSDDEIVALLSERPDLLHPVPADLGRLANAAVARPSLQVAVDQLDTFALQVLRTLAASEESMTYVELAAELGAPEDGRLRDTVDVLRTRALCFGDDDELTAPRELRKMPMLPAEFGPPLGQALAEVPPQRLRTLLEDVHLPYTESTLALRDLTKHFATPANVRALVAEVGPAAREALDRVASSQGRGRVTNAHRHVSVATATSPVEELLARGLLVAHEDDAVVLPFEVAVALPQRYREPPTLDVTTHEPSFTEDTGGLHAHAFVQATTDLLDAWADSPPSQLRSGGLGVRELRRAAELLDRTIDQAALVIETAYAARLLDSSHQDEEWLPTAQYDAWCAEPVATRWTTLAAAWLDTARAAGLVGEKDDRDKTINALGSSVLHGSVAQMRRATLEVLSSLCQGTAPSGASLVERVTWHRPRMGGRWRRRLVDWTMTEAEQLGVCGQGAVTSYGRALLDGDADAAGKLLDAALPRLGDEVLVQPDLTAVAPGPLQAAVRAELRLLADVESTGAATVYRFSTESVRRALDAGRTAAEVKDWLGRHSRTAVPQPLLYLVDDVARRHGQLRGGSAGSYLRSDDETLVAEIVAHRKATQLAVRQIAPTVLVSQLTRRELLDGLRDLGYAPVAESATGDVVLTSQGARRTRARDAAPWQPRRPERPSAHLVDQAVRVLRAGERMAGGRSAEQRASGDNLPRNPPRETLAALHHAIAEDRAVWIGYANAEGRTSLRLIEPVAVLGGLVEAYDHLRETRRSFSLHRITGYAPVDDAATS